MRSDLQKVFHYFPRVPDLIKRTAGYLSGGEMQMVLIGRALMARPKLLILDEPSMGLAPILVQQLFEIIGRIKREQGLTILLVEQNARAALAECDYGYVMDGVARAARHPGADRVEPRRRILSRLLRRGGPNRFTNIKHYRRRKRWLG